MSILGRPDDGEDDLEYIDLTIQIQELTIERDRLRVCVEELKQAIEKHRKTTSGMFDEGDPDHDLYQILDKMPKL